MAKRRIKSRLTSLVSREMQIKTKIRYHLTPVRMAIINKSTNNKCWRGCGKRGALTHCDGNADWCSHCGKQCGRFLKKLKMQLLCDPALTLLGILIYPKKPKTLIQKDTCIPTFIVVLFVTAKIWTQPKCPSTADWRRTRWCIYTRKYHFLSYHKKE